MTIELCAPSPLANVPPADVPPILVPPTIVPPGIIRLCTFDEVAATPGAWHVLHTRSRQEKALAETLTAMGIAAFLPLLDVTRTYGHRKLSVELPMFPGYLFLKGQLEDAYTADRTKRVAHIIPVIDQDKLTCELRNLSLALGARAPLDPYPYLRQGVRVEVRSGPLAGIQGIVESRLKRDRLSLQVDVLGQAMSLEIDGALLEVIGEENSIR
jgi:transcription antitermination factor NusG